MTEISKELFELLKQENKLTKVLLYPARTHIEDLNDKTTEEVFLPPVSIKALVNAQSFESLKWKYFSQLPYGTVRIIAEKKYLNLFKIVRKIEIDGERFCVYKDADKNFAILPRGDYLVIVAEKSGD